METCDLKGANRTAVVVAEVRSICGSRQADCLLTGGSALMLTPIFGKSALTRLPEHL